MHSSKVYDSLIIGGGPAGLTAAQYLGRFLRNVTVIDSGHSRAGKIPKSHNYPGAPMGVTGKELLAKMTEQAKNSGVEIRNGTVTGLIKSDLFIAETTQGPVQAMTVILATGMVDHQPDIPRIADFVYNGIVRFCPICDGYEAMDKIVAIIGPRAKLYKKALMLRIYTRDIVLFPLDDERHADHEKHLSSIGIEVPDQKIDNIQVHDNGVIGVWADGKQSKADLLYPAMGAATRLDFLRDISLKTNADGCVYTDAHQESNIQGLYAIGDITMDLSQIVVATGQAAIAATAIHNRLPPNCR